MSEETKVYPSGEQAAKLEGIENAVEKKLSKDEIERREDIDATTKTAKETWEGFKNGEFSGYQTLVKDPTLIKNEKARAILSSPFMSTVAQGLITAGYLGLYLPNRDMVPNDSMFAAAVSLSLPLAIHSGANTINALCKTNMAKCFGYALKNSVKDTINTVKNIERAKNIAEAKKRKEIAEKRKGELEVVDDWGDFIRAQKPQKNSVQQFFCQLKTMVQNKRGK